MNVNFNSAVLTKKGNELLVTAAAGKQIILRVLVTGCRESIQKRRSSAPR